MHCLKYPLSFSSYSQCLILKRHLSQRRLCTILIPRLSPPTTLLLLPREQPREVGMGVCHLLTLLTTPQLRCECPLTFLHLIICYGTYIISLDSFVALMFTVTYKLLFPS
jgi:hypothetical protein